MLKNYSNSGNDTPDWQKFEQDVALLFKLFGYDEVIHDIQINGGQYDVIAISSKKIKANVIIECKYHKKKSGKVSNADVEKFKARVCNLRSEGKIDHGYLVTNTGFTATSRAVLKEIDSNYIFLLTYDELIESLIDVNSYLRDFIHNYSNTDEEERFVDLNLVNTTPLNQTIMDCSPGDIVKDKINNISYLVIPKFYIEGNKRYLPFLDFENNLLAPILDPVKFFQKIKELHLKTLELNSECKQSHIKILLNAIEETALLYEDEILLSLFNLVRRETLEMILWAPEVVIKELLNIWENYGGDIKNNKLYRKSSLRRKIKREILERYKLKKKSIKFEQIKIPIFISTFRDHIFNAFNIIPREDESLLDVNNPWTFENELEKFSEHLNNYLEKLGGKQKITLKLIFEEKSLALLDELKTPKNNQILILIGDYGAGKTTIMRRLMFSLAKEKLTKTDDPTYRIPIYITLKDYNESLNVEDLIRMFLNKKMEVDNISIKTFKKLNEEGRFIILLDAFDEMLTKVSKATRRRCFREISELVYKKSKIILTGRPSYFKDYSEFKENLEILRNKESEINYQIKCLQLLDENQVEELILKKIKNESQGIFNLIVNNINLMDLARRPVLASMIAETGNELTKLSNKEISARDIYKIYTNKWIEREEDKGDFRLLTHADQKFTFMRYLAMQMHILGVMSIHYKKIDESIANYLGIKDMISIDAFSHSIRTCSFLSRTDDGFYFFMHKSFMEYFIACEYEQMENSPFADRFSNDLTNEIIDLINFEDIPKEILKVWKVKINFEDSLGTVQKIKNYLVYKQNYEVVSAFRDIEKWIEKVIESYNSVFTMKSDNKINFIKDFETYLNSTIEEKENLRSDDDYRSTLKLIKKHIRELIDTNFSEFNLDVKT